MSKVNVPGVGAVNFPDTMSPEAVASASQRLSQKAQGKGVGRGSLGQDSGIRYPRPNSEYGLPEDAAANVNAAAPGASLPGSEGGIEALTPGADMRARAAQGLSLLRPMGSVIGGLAAGGASLPSGPGAMLAASGGAAAGSATGRALELAGQRALGYQTPDAVNSALSIGGAGLQGGLEELTGNLGGRMLGKVGAGFVKSAIGKPGKALGEKIARQGLEPIEKTLIRRGLTTQAAADKAIEASDRSLQVVLHKARRAGIEFDPGDLARGVFDRIERARKYPIPVKDKTKLLKMTEDFLTDHPDALSAQGLQRLKQRFGDLVYKGKVDPAARYSLDTEFNEAIRGLAKQNLEGKNPLGSAAEKQILGPVQGINRETSALMRGRDALAGMATKGPLRPGGAMGGGLNLPVLSAVGVPRGAALNAGMAVGGPGARALSRQAPRAFSTLWDQMNFQPPPDAVDPLMEERMRQLGFQGGTP